MPKKGTNPWYRIKCVEIAKRLAKERDGYICQWCGKSAAEGYQMHGSHVFPEGTYHGMSAMVENIKCLCANCHKWRWHESPADGIEWFSLKFPERYAMLKALSRQTIKKDWKAEFEIMKSL